MFEYHSIVYKGVLFTSWDLIQYDMEKNLPAFLGKKAEEVENIIIVGAWQGDEVRSFLRFPKAQIYCFEPNPATFKILRELYKGEPRVHCFQKACASTNGNATFYETNMVGNGSMLPIGSHPLAKQAESFTVQTVRLDSLPELLNKNIDLLWVDVQGFELEVLKGAAGLLPEIEALFLEVSLLGGNYKNAVTLSDLEAFVQSNGFLRISQGLGEEDQKGDGNALFVKSRVALSLYSSNEVVQRRLQVILDQKIQKRKIYSSRFFKLIHAITPQRIRTFIKKRLQ